MKQCKWDKCSELNFSRGYCRKHYKRYRASPEFVMYINNDEYKFWQKVLVTPYCWLWKPGPKDAKGYGEFRWNGKGGYPHRFSYQLFMGKLVKGMVISQKCLNKICVNPDHLMQQAFGEAVSNGAYGLNNRIDNTMRCRNGHFIDESNVVVTGSYRTCGVCLKIRQANYVPPRQYVRKVASSRYTRTEVFKLDNGICYLCQMPIPEGKLHLDHIYPIVFGGEDAIYNIAATHERCNESKSSILPDKIITYFPDSSIPARYSEHVYYHQEYGCNCNELTEQIRSLTKGQKII